MKNNILFTNTSKYWNMTHSPFFPLSWVLQSSIFQDIQGCINTFVSTPSLVPGNAIDCKSNRCCIHSGRPTCIRFQKLMDEIPLPCNAKSSMLLLPKFVMLGIHKNLKKLVKIQTKQSFHVK